ncbi:hypothetical protein DFJ74DRAFT_710890 [Hyaloraphidium curvatum]|nr:hypothetical protein DFJ74DRAFT_710890 [Hyaloraphidium curvatum]
MPGEADPYEAVLAFLRSYDGRAGNKQHMRLEPLRRLHAAMRTDLAGEAATPNPKLGEVREALEGFLRSPAINSEWGESVKLVCSLLARAIALESRTPVAADDPGPDGRNDGGHSRILALLDDESWPALARLCLIRAALAELGTWCNRDAEGADHSQVMFAHISRDIVDRLEHPMFRIVALDNLAVFLEKHRLESDTKAQDLGRLLDSILWMPSEHDGTGSNRSLIKTCTELLLLNMSKVDQTGTRELLVEHVTRTVDWDFTRVGLWGHALRFIGVPGLVAAARKSNLQIPPDANDQVAFDDLLKYLVESSASHNSASGRVSDTAEALLLHLWEQEMSFGDGKPTLEAARRWAARWMRSVVAAFPADESDGRFEHMLTMLDERIIRHAASLGPHAVAAIILTFFELSGHGEGSQAGTLCAMLAMKRLFEKDWDTMAQLLGDVDPAAMVRAACLHPSRAMRLHAMSVQVQHIRTFVTGLAGFVESNVHDVAVLDSDAFWKFVERWSNASSKLTAQNATALRSIAVRILSRPTADPRRHTVALKLLGIIGFDPAEHRLVDMLLNVVARDLLEINRTMACDLLVGFASGECRDSVFNAVRPRLNLEAWTAYARSLMSHRRSLERLRGAMLFRTIAFYIAGKEQDGPVGKAQTEQAREALFAFVADVADEAKGTTEKNAPLESINPKLHGLLYSMQLILLHPRSPFGKKRRRGEAVIIDGRLGLDTPTWVLERLMQPVLGTLRTAMSFFGSTSYVVGEGDFDEDEDGDDSDADEDGEAPATDGDAEPNGNAQNGFSFQSALKNTRLISTNIWWRSVKAAAALATFCVENWLSCGTDAGPRPEVLELMDLLMDGMLTIRHWGAAASLELAFTSICGLAWRASVAYHPKIFASAERAIDMLRSRGVERLDHRYAGISRILLGIMKGTEKSKQVADFCRDAIWKMATDDDLEAQSVKVNALNVLIWIFKDTIIGPLFPLEGAFILALEAMSSDVTVLARVATFLFAHALIPRAFTDMGLHRYGIRAADAFFEQNPKLLASIRGILSRAAESGDLSGSDLFAALVLLSRLKPPAVEASLSGDPDRAAPFTELADLVQAVLAGSRAAKVREMAAKALWATTPESLRADRVRSLASLLQGREDSKHGALYAFEYLLSEMDPGHDDAVRDACSGVDPSQLAPWNLALFLRLSRRFGPDDRVSSAALAVLSKPGPMPGADQVKIALVRGASDADTPHVFDETTAKSDWEACRAILEAAGPRSAGARRNLARSCGGLLAGDLPKHFAAVVLDFLAGARESAADVLPPPAVLYRWLGADPRDTDQLLVPLAVLLASTWPAQTPAERARFAELMWDLVHSEEDDARAAVAAALREPAIAGDLPGQGLLLTCTAWLLFDPSEAVRESAARTAQGVLGWPLPQNTTATLPMLVDTMVALGPDAMPALFSLRGMPADGTPDDDWSVTPWLECAVAVMEAAFDSARKRGVRLQPGEADQAAVAQNAHKKKAGPAYPLGEMAGCVRNFHEYRRRIVAALEGDGADEGGLEAIREAMDRLVFK